MKLYIKLILAGIVVLIGAFGLIKSGIIPVFVPPVGEATGTEYFMTGSNYKNNYVYGGAMQLAVNELNANILHGKLMLKLTESDAETTKLLNIFNRGEFSTKDLDAPSYYVKSGYGQNTVSTINRESKAKFPDKTFGDLTVQLRDKDIISYAYFLKQIEYATEFKKNTILFLGNKVKGFEADGKDQRENVQIVEYKNDDNFIIKLKLKDNSDEIYLAKGYKMNNPENSLDIIRNKTITKTMGKDDIFQAPDIHLDMSRNYDGFKNKKLLNISFEDYLISEMYENIKFDMDNKGARVENEAVMVVAFGAIPGNQPEIKRLILDKPYWVVMKRADSKNPYFILGVKNSEILVKSQ